MNVENIKELLKLVSSLDKDWNGNENATKSLFQFLTKIKESLRIIMWNQHMLV